MNGLETVDPVEITGVDLFCSPFTAYAVTDRVHRSLRNELKFIGVITFTNSGCSAHLNRLFALLRSYFLLWGMHVV